MVPQASQAPPAASTAVLPGSESPVTESAKDRYKKTRKANQLTQKAIEQELDTIASQVDRLIYDASKRIGVEVAELTSQFLAKSSATHDRKATAWNGLVAKVSLDLSYKKEQPEFKGAAFMSYVVQHIHENGLYTSLTAEQKDEMIAYAQKVRDDRVNAGHVKTIDQRLTQGSVKDEIFAMIKRLAHLHSLLGVECLILTARGSSEDGLKPVYYASPKTQQFFETHLKLEMGNVIELLEKSVTSGATGVVKHIEKTKSELKTDLRDTLTRLLRDAATQTASDGWPPVTKERNSIKISYVNFKNTKRIFGVDVFGWPMEENGSMRDPSNLGGNYALRQWIAKLEDGQAGFNRMTKDEHRAWLKEHQTELSTEAVKVRSKAQKRQASKQSSTSEPPQKKQTRKNASVATNKPGTISSNINTPSTPASTTTSAPGPTETIDPPAASPPRAPTPVYDFDEPTEAHLTAPSRSNTPYYPHEMPEPYSQHSVPSTATTAIFNLPNYGFPAFDFNSTSVATNFLAQSPTYPLVPVTAPRPARVGAGAVRTQRPRRDSATSQISVASTQSYQPATPTTPRPRRDKDGFVNNSPAYLAERSQRKPRRRTKTASSTPSRINTPTPQDANTHNQGPAFVPSTSLVPPTTSSFSLYRSELADPRM